MVFVIMILSNELKYTNYSKSIELNLTKVYTKQRERGGK